MVGSHEVGTPEVGTQPGPLWEIKVPDIALENVRSYHFTSVAILLGGRQYTLHFPDNKIKVLKRSVGDGKWWYLPGLRPHSLFTVIWRLCH